ncbi:hypothetical protein [Dactylosporangium sp. CA-139066]|uniref:hypothetical protein n=1 Tax=Dactylosporangium sp. CA-139066 TaxID=3239930 RepID=UPI003D8E38E8
MRFFMQAAVTRLVNRAVGLAHRLVGFGAGEPFAGASALEAPAWAELAAERRLHRLAGR